MERASYKASCIRVPYKQRDRFHHDDIDSNLATGSHRMGNPMVLIGCTNSHRLLNNLQEIQHSDASYRFRRWCPCNSQRSTARLLMPTLEQIKHSLAEGACKELRLFFYLAKS